jgi:hypothetical protein
VRVESDRPTSLEQCYRLGTPRICSSYTKLLAAYNNQYLFDQQAVVLTNQHRDDDNEYDLAGVSLNEPKWKRMTTAETGSLLYYPPIAPDTIIVMYNKK